MTDGILKCAQGPTWQQAVQWVEEVHLVPGQRFNLVAKHDTYGLSFALQTDKPAAESGTGRGSENAPPLWVNIPPSHPAIFACSLSQVIYSV